MSERDLETNDTEQMPPEEELVINDLPTEELIELREELRSHRGWINNRLGSIRAELERRSVDPDGERRQKGDDGEQSADEPETV